MLTAGGSFVLTAVATILAAGACSRSDGADLLTPNSPEERAKVLENADEWSPGGAAPVLVPHFISFALLDYASGLHLIHFDDSLRWVPMEYRQLGSSGATISIIGLGGNVFGQHESFTHYNDEGETAAIIDCAADLGVNHIDTADMYSRGVSETYIGKAIAGKRDRFPHASSPPGYSLTNRKPKR